MGYFWRCGWTRSLSYRVLSQKEKNIYRILRIHVESRKNGAHEPIYRAGIETDIENEHVDKEGEGEGGAN